MKKLGSELSLHAQGHQQQIAELKHKFSFLTQKFIFLPTKLYHLPVKDIIIHLYYLIMLTYKCTHDFLTECTARKNTASPNKFIILWLKESKIKLLKLKQINSNLPERFSVYSETSFFHFHQLV